MKRTICTICTFLLLAAAASVAQTSRVDTLEVKAKLSGPGVPITWEWVCGSENGSTLDNKCSFNGAMFNRLGKAITITEVFCQVDAGTPRIQLYKETSNSATTHDGTTNVLTDNSDAGQDCSSSGTTGTLDSSAKALANGNHLDFVLVDPSTTKRLTVELTITVD